MSASGADPNRKEFNRLKAEIAAKKIDVVVTMRAATIARNWGQFMEYKFIFQISGNQSLIGFHLVFKRVFLSSAVCGNSGISTNPFLL
mgnify:CR=1 FL=1